MAQTFYEVLTAAVADITLHGYDSEERVQRWVEELRIAAKANLVSERVLEDALKRVLTTAYGRLIDKGGILRTNPGVSAFTLQRIKPKLRSELDRRIMASANLIKVNREVAIERTLQRFSGWSTSIPAGGAPKTVEKTDTKIHIRKALAQLPFEERRVLIDQGHKLNSSLNSIVANDGGAIAGYWHSHWKQVGYDYRKDHKERDGHCYAIRGSWAISQGLMTKGDGYTDEMTQPAEEVFCRCNYRYVYALRDLPKAMLTQKGQAALDEVRAKLRAA